MREKEAVRYAFPKVAVREEKGEISFSPALLKIINFNDRRKQGERMRRGRRKKQVLPHECVRKPT